METITERVDALVAGLGELTDEQLVHAAVARRIASFMDDGEVTPSYALGGLARELRAALAALTGSPQAAGVTVVTDDDLDRLLRGV